MRMPCLSRDQSRASSFTACGRGEWVDAVNEDALLWSLDKLFQIHQVAFEMDQRAVQGTPLIRVESSTPLWLGSLLLWRLPTKPTHHASPPDAGRGCFCP